MPYDGINHITMAGCNSALWPFQPYTCPLSFLKSNKLFINCRGCSKLNVVLCGWCFHSFQNLIKYGNLLYYLI